MTNVRSIAVGAIAALAMSVMYAIGFSNGKAVGWTDGVSWTERKYEGVTARTKCLDWVSATKWGANGDGPSVRTYQLMCSDVKDDTP